MPTSSPPPLSPSYVLQANRFCVPVKVPLLTHCLQNTLLFLPFSMGHCSMSLQSVGLSLSHMKRAVRAALPLPADAHRAAGVFRTRKVWCTDRLCDQ